MVVFMDLWSCLFTTKLSYAQLFKWGHSNHQLVSKNFRTRLVKTSNGGYINYLMNPNNIGIQILALFFFFYNFSSCEEIVWIMDFKSDFYWSTLLLIIAFRWIFQEYMKKVEKSCSNYYQLTLECALWNSNLELQ